MVGMGVGAAVVGLSDGDVVLGERVGAAVIGGNVVGEFVPETTGLAVGLPVGPFVGECDGVWLGLSVGIWVGDSVGLDVGNCVGMAVGVLVGICVGVSVGTCVGMVVHSPHITGHNTPNAPHTSVEYELQPGSSRQTVGAGVGAAVGISVMGVTSVPPQSAVLLIWMVDTFPNSLNHKRNLSFWSSFVL